jgi:hypothetical protein
VIFSRLLDLRDRLLNVWDHVATMPRRAFVYAALALAAPLPAFALSQNGGDAAPAALSVSASLDQCGLIETEVVCKLDASYGELPGATSYTASVTRADGSVVDYGEVGAGATSLWVPYVGSGTYTVEIAAYGDPKRAGGKPRLLSRDQSSAEGRAPGRARPSERTVRPGFAEPRETLDQDPDGPGGAQGGAPAAPDCEEVEAPDGQEPPLDADGDGVPDEAAGAGETGAAASEDDPAALTGVPNATAAALEAEGALPESVDCPSD